MAEIRRNAAQSKMPDIVVMTVVRKALFSHQWNATDDFFEERQLGFVDSSLGSKPRGMFVYDRCGLPVGKITMFPNFLDELHVWKVIHEAYYNRCRPTSDPDPQPEVKTNTAPTEGNNPN